MNANTELPLTNLAQDDVDPRETNEWLEALEAVLKIEGAARAHYLL